MPVSTAIFVALPLDKCAWSLCACILYNLETFQPFYFICFAYFSTMKMFWKIRQYLDTHRAQNRASMVTEKSQKMDTIFYLLFEVARQVLDRSWKVLLFQGIDFSRNAISINCCLRVNSHTTINVYQSVSMKLLSHLFGRGSVKLNIVWGHYPNNNLIFVRSYTHLGRVIFWLLSFKANNLKIKSFTFSL